MRRRMSRKERARRRRIITITVTSVVAVVIIVAAALLIKSCAGKKNTDAADNNAISETTQNVNNNSNNSVSSTQAESTENKSTEAATDNASDGKEKTSKGFTIETRNGATYIDGYLIANKTYALPSTFIPENPEVPVTEARSNTSLDKDLMTAFRKMQADATAKGLNIYVANDGKTAADTYSSRPGNSEHQTGLCFDLNSIEDSFQYTNEGKWINDNCYKYGFCIRFPKGKDAYTGYQYESWHLRYVGEELAEKLYNNGDWISLEEYFGITSEYPN